MDALISTWVKYVRNPATYRPDPASDVYVAGGRDPEDSPVAPGQGRQLDAHTRKLIEDAPQHRLMQYYRDAGWEVTDTHLTEPYDAIAVKGDEVLYLEAKGTQSRGKSVIVTRNEVSHARAHPGACVMGVWSGMKIVEDHIHPDAADFRLVDFDPGLGDLRPRDYDWWLPG